MSKIEIGAVIILLVAASSIARNWFSSDNTISPKEAILWCQENGGTLNSDQVCEISGSLTWEEISKLSDD
jgi:hypothetical protein